MGPCCFTLSTVSNVDRTLTAALSRETTSLKASLRYAANAVSITASLRLPIVFATMFAYHEKSSHFSVNGGAQTLHFFCP